jgi:hypothetical protein
MSGRFIRVIVATAALWAIAAPSAFAQLCAGSPSYASGPMQLNMGGDFTSGSQQFGGGIGFGAQEESGPFANVSLGIINSSDLDAKATHFGGGLGYEIPNAAGSNVFVCPVMSMGYTSGPDIADVDVSVLQFGAGAQAGFVAFESGNMSFVPTLGLGLARARVKSTFLGQDATVSDNFGLFNIGLGIIVNRTMSLTPAVTFPFGLDGGDASFRIGVAVQFGR